MEGHGWETAVGGFDARLISGPGKGADRRHILVCLSVRPITRT